LPAGFKVPAAPIGQHTSEEFKMPSVMFWNIARAGSDYKAEELRDSLAVLTHKIQPAAIVLC
jgi:hypothetical protein